MKYRYILSGLLALALSVGSVEGVGLSAVTNEISASAATTSELRENAYYNATGTWTYTYTGDQLQAVADSGSVMFSKNEDGTYTCGFNIQVGHMKNALVTMKVTSTANNIFNGYNDDESFVSGSEDYLWTVQTSWNCNAPADDEMGTIKYTDKSAEGATELKSWDSGSTKFNGQWAQFMLTDDNLSAVTLEVTVVADSKTKWEYHEPVDGKDNMYTVISVMGGSYVEEIPYSEINSQLLTNTDKDLPEASTSDSTHSASSGSTASVGTGSTSVNVQYTKIGNATVGNITDKTYTGSAIKPTPSVKLNGKTLKKGTDYTLSYKNNTKVGTATVTITGKGDYAGTITKSFKIKAASISKAKVASVSNKVYTGKAIKPTPSVKLGSKTLKKGTDYTVSYSNNIKTGKATITIKGKGNYTGTVKKTFKIVPKKATLSSVTSPKTKNVKISWKKDSQATGYEVVYATNSKFTSGKKTVTVTKNTTTSKTISKLTKGKTYYVKVRSYKTIDGKKVYGSYSTVKKIKCK